ncbi:rRNA-processing protein and EBNA1-binding protein ebp2 [Puccinia graminis f. sp. tritici]|uniref:rRNA-processing protein and EBNA1-binding protein ebp2 n=1 Tax=Puccinia graminis f. sp. tritici TaxID=56615 RepID=A0A5B0LLU9_PUCGR|nr:rRNA-processing protein and EBNA1-binding protein ebp2 [Puccinia graminis f. sp. tritici]
MPHFRNPVLRLPNRTKPTQDKTVNNLKSGQKRPQPKTPSTGNKTGGRKRAQKEPSAPRLTPPPTSPVRSPSFHPSEDERSFHGNEDDEADPDDNPSQSIGFHGNEADRNGNPSQSIGLRGNEADPDGNPSQSIGFRGNEADRNGNPSQSIGFRGNEADRNGKPSDSIVNRQQETLPIDPVINSLDARFRESGSVPEGTTTSETLEFTAQLVNKFRAMSKLDDEHFSLALEICNFKYSPVFRDCIRDLTKEAFLRHDIQLYTRGKYKPGTSDVSLLRVVMFRRRELPPNYDTDAQTKKELIGVVREIQRRVRLMIRERLLDGIVQSNGQVAEDGLVPSLYELCETIYRFLHPGEASMSKATVRKNITILWAGRIGHLRLQTVDHLIHPQLSKVSQWGLIDEKLKELRARGTDYTSAWGKAILAKDNAAFGQKKSFGEIDHEIITVPTKDEVQEKLSELDGFLENVRFEVLRVPSIGWSSQSHGKLAGQPSSAPTKSRPARPVVYAYGGHACITEILHPVETSFAVLCPPKQDPTPKTRHRSHINPNMASLESLFSNPTATAPGGFGASVGLDFFETQLVDSQARTSVEDVNDDLKIEVELYKNALEAAQQAVRKFETSGKPFFRPSDYFAEMIKSDAHMETIRLRLVEEAEGLKASEEAKKKRELKKFGKAIQVENKLQREKETKRIKEGVKELRKSW